MYKVIVKLINTASLVSTKAKNTNSGFSVVYDSEVNEIVILIDRKNVLVDYNSIHVSYREDE